MRFREWFEYSVPGEFGTMTGQYFAPYYGDAILYTRHSLSCARPREVACQRGARCRSIARWKSTRTPSVCHHIAGAVVGYAGRKFSSPEFRQNVNGDISQCPQQSTFTSDAISLWTMVTSYCLQHIGISFSKKRYEIHSLV